KISETRNLVSEDKPPALSDACWVLTDGTIGMENQALGLAERLGLPIVVKQVKLAWPWDRLAPFSPSSPFGRIAGGSDPVSPPWPRLVIGVGRQSIPFALAIKEASRARTLIVQCQDPRISPAKFDL